MVKSQGIRIDLERFLFLLLVGFVFQRLVLLSARRWPDHMINAFGGAGRG